MALAKQEVGNNPDAQREHGTRDERCRRPRPDARSADAHLLRSPLPSSLAGTFRAIDTSSALLLKPLHAWRGQYKDSICHCSKSSWLRCRYGRVRFCRRCGGSSYRLDGASACGSSIAPQSNEVILDWVHITLETIKTDKMAPPIASRALAMESIAVFDSISAVLGTRGYLVQHPVALGASLEAAAASAAHDVLAALFPTHASDFRTQLAASLQQITTSNWAEIAGVSLGQEIARYVISLRADDGSAVLTPYVPGTALGDWRPTPPAFAPALLPQWADLMPFAMTSADQFQPSGPPALDSPEYAAALNQVKSLGALNSTTRTGDQTEIALFWADGAGTYTPPGHWDAIAARLASEKHTSFFDTAKLFTELNIALADAGVAAWNAKYEYSFWRPITAIAAAGVMAIRSRLLIPFGNR